MNNIGAFKKEKHRTDLATPKIRMQQSQLDINIHNTNM